MDELESQLADLVKDLGEHRRTAAENPLGHVSVEIKAIELLTRIRSSAGKGKEPDGMHPEVARMMAKKMGKAV